MLKTIIQTMVDVDQSARFHARESKGNFPPNLLVYAIDASHSHKIRTIIQEYGYPTTKIIGKRGMKNWWLLVQHQDLDLDIQKKCLEHCDFSPEEYAHLTDRVLINSGETQRYGTQLNAPVGDRKKTDEERRKLGLLPLKVYLEETKRLAEQYRRQKR